MLLAFPTFASNSDADDYFPQRMSAQDLLTACASSSISTTGRVRRRYCDGFISGVEESMRLYKLRYSTETMPTICVPNGTTSRALADAFIKYASANGNELQQPAAAVVLQALQHHFAC